MNSRVNATLQLQWQLRSLWFLLIAIIKLSSKLIIQWQPRSLWFFLVVTCISRRGGQGLEAGCLLRYATYSFFQTCMSFLVLSQLFAVWFSYIMSVDCLDFVLNAASLNWKTNQVLSLTPSMGKSSSKILRSSFDSDSVFGNVPCLYYKSKELPFNRWLYIVASKLTALLRFYWLYLIQSFWDNCCSHVDENLAARENFEQVYFDYAVLRN